MRRLNALVVAAGAALLATGCLARQVADDGIGLRQVLVDLYTDQAMDNLVRAHENRPFVQLKYSQLSVNDKLTGNVASAGAELNRTGGRTTDLTKTGPVRFTEASGFGGRLPVVASADSNRTMSFRADPVIDRNEVYEAYIEFARNPALLCVSETKPDCPVHALKESGGKWYWVPVEAATEFLQLVVKTSLAPPPSAPAAVAWDATVMAVAPRYNAAGRRTENEYVVTLSRDVPNDEGILQVTLPDGRKARVATFPLFIEPFKPGVAEQKPQASNILQGAPTSRLYAWFSPQMLPENIALQLGFRRAPALFFSQHYPNPSAKQAEDSARIIDELNSIRIQLTKPGSNP